MPESEVQKIAEEADFIVNGYAFTSRSDGFVSILNLEHPDCAIVINKSLEIIETNMDEIEQVTWCTASHNGVPQVLDFIRKFYFIFY